MRLLILHIVKSGETIRAIADNYQCEVSDITSNNLHITDFKNLRPGMKLRIPFLSKPIIDVLEETESFISDYYPSINKDFSKPGKDTKNDNIPSVKEEINTNDIPIVDEVKISEEKPATYKDLNDVNTYSRHSEYQYKNVCYYGNVIPNIPDKFIKKI